MITKSAIYSTVCILFGLATADLRAEIVYIEPPTVESLVSIDDVRIDGTLSLIYELGSWTVGSQQSIPFNIVHRLKVAPSGRPRSEMVITGLTPLAVPVDRSHMRCTLLGGAEVTFGSEGLSEALKRVRPSLLARRPAVGQLELRSPGGWYWSYQNGGLIAAGNTNSFRIAVLESQGAKPVLLRATNMSGIVAELKATYDSTGSMTTLAFGLQKHEFLYSGPRHQMTDWISTTDNKEMRTKFEYKDELLVRVTQSGFVVRNIQWDLVPGGFTADTEWPSPVRVSKFGERQYLYTLNYKGYAMVTEDRETKMTEKRILNTRRGLIDLLENNKLVRRFMFGVDTSQSDAGKIIRIEDGRGNIIAKYKYDVSGRVSSFWAGNEIEPINFVYDQYGRHPKPVQAHVP